MSAVIRDEKSLESILFSRQDELNPIALKKLATEWGGAVADRVGKDYGQPNFFESLRPHIERVQREMPPSRGRMVLNELSEAIESQWEVADAIYEAYQPQHFARHETSLFSNPAIHLRSLISNPVALLNFLKEPFNPTVMDRFIKSQRSFSPDQAQKLHEDFWALTQAERKDVLGNIFDLGEKDGQFDRVVHEIIEDQFGLIWNFLPPDNRPDDGGSAHQVGLKMANNFYLMPDDETIVVAIAAMLDAVHDDKIDQQSAEPRTADPDERAGWRLGRFLSDFDSGGGHKTAQFAHSAPDRNDKWDPGLSSSKSQADLPDRREFIRRLRQSVRQEIQDNMHHIGARRGTGSWLSTYGIELEPAYVARKPAYQRYRENHSDKGLVIAINKPDAYKKGVKFFDDLLTLADIVEEEARNNNDQQALNSIASMRKIVTQARRALQWETNQHNSPKQEEIARKFLEGLVVDVGGHKYSFYTQDAFEYDEEFRVSLDVEGVHFNRLPNTAEDEKLYKRQTAIAWFAAAALMVLRGEAFDHDIHGDNGAAKKTGPNATILGKFDNGAIDTADPTDIQKETFADCIANALLNKRRNGYPLFSSLRFVISETAKNLGLQREEDLQYINRVLQSVISDGDYIRHMRSADFKEVGLAILQTGGADPKILGRLYSRLVTGGTALSRLSAFEKEQERLYYPENPNPRRDARQSKKRDGSGARYQRLKVRITFPNRQSRTTASAMTSGLAALIRAVR